MAHEIGTATAPFYHELFIEIGDTILHTYLDEIMLRKYTILYISHY